jgi:hypothetical protein
MGGGYIPATRQVVFAPTLINNAAVATFDVGGGGGADELAASRRMISCGESHVVSFEMEGGVRGNASSSPLALTKLFNKRLVIWRLTDGAMQPMGSMDLPNQFSYVGPPSSTKRANAV